MSEDRNSGLELAVLTQIRDSVASLTVDMRDTRDRVIKLETRDERVAELSRKVDVLMREKDQRDGAVNIGTWLLKNWPGIIAFVAMVVVVLKSTGRL